MKNFEAASSLAEKLKAAGFTITTEGGRLRVAPADMLTDELRDQIKQHRDALIPLVAKEALQPAPAARVGIDPTPADKTAPRANMAPSRLSCGSCLHYQPGEPNPAESLGRCLLTVGGGPPHGGGGYRACFPMAPRTCSHFDAIKEAL